MQRCHTYKIAVSKYVLREHWGGGAVGLGGKDACERRIKVFVKIQKKKIFFRGGGVGLGVRVDVNREREVKFL